jgi:signal recognition particle subunit SRP54
MLIFPGHWVWFECAAGYANWPAIARVFAYTPCIFFIHKGIGMFANLSQRLTGIIGNLKRKGVLTEADLDATLREVRVALLEADVALPVVKQFTQSLREKAVGAEVIKSVSPAQMIIKLVHDHLTELLGGENTGLNLNTTPPAVILMVGLQGSGKTTTSGKLALLLKQKQGKRVMLASLDTQRPGAQLQLETLAGQVSAVSLPIIAGQGPLEITERALKASREAGADVLILDTAGRLHIDESLMGELKAVRDMAKPIETLLVVDSMTGQDAVKIAEHFHGQIGVTGTVLTRLDGDGRGGAALSMRTVTGQPIKFAGMGEKLDQLEPFHPERVASRILDMGDVVSLVERAAETIKQEDAEAMAKRMAAGKFDFNDLLNQLRQMEKMGGIGGLMGMMPGMGKIKDAMANANVDERTIKHQEAIILSMTPKERANPKLIAAKRKARIAAGSGRSIQEVNKLLKAQLQMEDMMKKMKKMGGMGAMMKGMMGAGGGLGGLMGGGMPPFPGKFPR